MSDAFSSQLIQVVLNKWHRAQVNCPADVGDGKGMASLAELAAQCPDGPD
eukprot:CAMPEP_0179197780 /NCGR_PEP_ID=MMETSP0796-20121207/98360_1 /TAXON_ID=73915 /ORGANISM="Pyrodinium bahamense, Strain pbaha01" /LENGTH=49 /DNA_ID= /DNA_START= /DNA_END= /DNA_ORIENTATION=